MHRTFSECGSAIGDKSKENKECFISGNVIYHLLEVDVTENIYSLFAIVYNCGPTNKDNKELEILDSNPSKITANQIKR